MHGVEDGGNRVGGVDLRVAKVTDENGLRALRDEWDGLLRASGQECACLHHEWVTTWWETFGSAGRLHVVTCRGEDGSLLGVMPTFERRGGRVFRTNTAHFIGDEWDAGLAPFASPDVRVEVYACFADYASAGDHGWDLTDLRGIDSEHPFFLETAGRPRTIVEHDTHACPRILLPGSWDEYLAAQPKHRRHELRRVARRAEEQGAEVEVVVDPGELPQAIEDFLSLHENRMRRKLAEEFSPLPPEYKRFLGVMAEKLLASGRLRLMFLRVGDRRVAVSYLYRYGDTMYYERSGFDVDADAFGLRPLVMHAIRSAIEEGCKVFDLMAGTHAYKSDWGATDLRSLSRVRVYAPNVAGRARYLRDSLEACRSRKETAETAVPEGANA